MVDQTKTLLKDYLGAILFAVIFALLLRGFVIEAYRIPSNVMKPSLLPGDLIFVAKWPFGWRYPWSDSLLKKGRNPRYGEIVTYQLGEDQQTYIKRVIGLPGDRVGIRNGRIVFNGEELAFDAQKKGTEETCGLETHPKSGPYSVCLGTPSMPDAAEKEVPSVSAFVVGDYRGKAGRRQNWAVVPIAALRAKAMWIWLSMDTEKTGTFPELRKERLFKRIK